MSFDSLLNKEEEEGNYFVVTVAVEEAVQVRCGKEAGGSGGRGE